MRQPQRASSICQKVAKSLSNRAKARGQMTYLQNEGWKFIDKAKEIFSLRSLVPECKFTVLNIRTGSRWDIFNKIITTALLLGNPAYSSSRNLELSVRKVFYPYTKAYLLSAGYFSSNSRITECSKSVQALSETSGKIYGKIYRRG